MDGGRVNHSWCMNVDSHRHSGLGGSRMEVVVGRHARQRQEGLVACLEMPEHFPSTRCKH